MSHQRVGPAPNETRQRMARSFFCPNYFGLLFHRRRRRRLGSARLIGRPGFYVQLDFRSFFFGGGGYFFFAFYGRLRARRFGGGRSPATDWLFLVVFLLSFYWSVLFFCGRRPRRLLLDFTGAALTATFIPSSTIRRHPS